MLELKNIRKEYVLPGQTVVALDDVSLNFRQSEFVSILGPSGCGKTTMLNVIGGLDKYSTGDLVIKGRSTKEFKAKDWDSYRNHSIGFVFQSYNLIAHLSVLGNVELALTLSGVSRKERKRRAMDVLSRVGLVNEINKKPNQLSGGQMQRVAIARALVNNPEILLADEPTGALDTKTSIEVMELIKEISKERLVIMVTHNAEIAEKYSSRIIKLLDGKIISDSKPYKPKRTTKTKEKINEVEPQKQIGIKKDKSAMSVWTAMGLSGRNLISKKGRTTLTSIAGSIGIVGICLVLAVSNGFNKYIGNLQSEALGGYPISVSAISMDSEAFTSFSIDDDSENVDRDVAVSYDPNSQFIQFGHYNLLDQDFVSHVKNFENKDKEKGDKSEFNMIEYLYFTPLKIVSRNEANNYNLFVSENSTSVLSGSQNDAIYPMLSNLDYVMTQYELIYGSMPEKRTGDEFTKEMILVVGKGNKISVNCLRSLGYQIGVGEYPEIDFSDICSKDYKLLYNDEYYTADSENFDSISSFSKLDKTNQSALQSAYENSATTLKISGVIRLKEDAKVELLTSGVAFMPDLGDHYRADCEESLIARKQRANAASGAFYDNYKISVMEIPLIEASAPLGFPTASSINNFLQLQFEYQLTESEAFELAMQQIGISEYPAGIYFYPKNFDSKDSVIDMINSYNDTQPATKDKIVYSDSTGFLTDTLGEMIKIVSYVLIAFAAISLVVSSIMIGIITYVSVIERTKEIGVLRSIGARKKDIIRVFNAETFFIGLLAGVIGAVISFLLCFPINWIVSDLAPQIGNIAVLKFGHAAILTGVSVVLTLISGLIPSFLASKKDPVVALRTD